MNKQEIIEYCLTFHASYEDYPFDDVWAVMRHGINKKSFAYIYERKEKLCVNVKCDPDKADFLRQIYNDIEPGYHMDKRHWITINVGGDVDNGELFGLIQESYDLIKPKAKRRSDVEDSK